MLVLVCLFLFTVQCVHTQYISLAALSLRLPGRCMFGEFDCGFGSCVPVTAFHNGQPDCRDGSDEWCFFGQIKCGSMCVNFLDHNKCHKKYEDKRNCNISKPFPCKGYGQIVSIDSLMDGKNDCSDNSDEDANYVRALEASFHCWYNRTLTSGLSMNDFDATDENPTLNSSPEVVEFGNFITPIANQEKTRIVPISVVNDEIQSSSTNTIKLEHQAIVEEDVYNHNVQSSSPQYPKEDLQSQADRVSFLPQALFFFTTPKPISSEVKEKNSETEFFPVISKFKPIVAKNNFLGDPITPVDKSDILSIFEPHSNTGFEEKSKEKIDVWVFPSQLPETFSENGLNFNNIKENNNLPKSISSQNKYEVLEPFKSENVIPFSKPITPAGSVIFKPFSSSSSSSIASTLKPSSPSFSSLSSLQLVSITSSSSTSTMSTTTELLSDPTVESLNIEEHPTILLATEQPLTSQIKHLNIGGENPEESSLLLPLHSIDISTQRTTVHSQWKKPTSADEKTKPPYNTETHSESEDKNKSATSDECYYNTMSKLKLGNTTIPYCSERYEVFEGYQQTHLVRMKVNRICDEPVSFPRNTEDRILQTHFDKMNASLCRNTFDDSILTIECSYCYDFPNNSMEENSVYYFAESALSISECSQFESIITNSCMNCEIKNDKCECSHDCVCANDCPLPAILWLLIIAAFILLLAGFCWLYRFCKRIDRVEANCFTDIYDKIKFWHARRRQVANQSQNGQAQGNNQQTTVVTTENSGDANINNKIFVAPRKHATSEKVEVFHSSTITMRHSDSIPDSKTNDSPKTSPPQTIVVNPKDFIVEDPFKQPDNNQLEHNTQTSTIGKENHQNLRNENVIHTTKDEDDEVEHARKLNTPPRPSTASKNAETIILPNIPSEGESVSNSVASGSKKSFVGKTTTEKTLWETFKENKDSSERIPSSSSLKRIIIENHPEILSKWEAGKPASYRVQKQKERIPSLSIKELEHEETIAVVLASMENDLVEPLTVAEESFDNLMASNDKKALKDLSRNNIDLVNPFALIHPKRLRSQSRSVPNILKTTKHKESFRSTDLTTARSLEHNGMTEAAASEINERSQTEFINSVRKANTNANISTAPTVIENNHLKEHIGHNYRSLTAKRLGVNEKTNDSQKPRRRSTSRRNHVSDFNNISPKSQPIAPRTSNSLSGRTRNDSSVVDTFFNKNIGRTYLRSSQSSVIETKKSHEKDRSLNPEQKVDKQNQKISRSRLNSRSNDQMDLPPRAHMSSEQLRRDRNEKSLYNSSGRASLRTASISNDVASFHRHIMERNLSRQRRNRDDSAVRKSHRSKEELWWDH